MRISDWSSDVCSSDLVADAELADLLLLWHNDEIHALTRDQVQCTFNASVDLSRRLYKLKWTPSSATRICPDRQGRALWSDLLDRAALAASAQLLGLAQRMLDPGLDARQSVGKGKGGAVRVEHGCRRISKK